MSKQFVRDHDFRRRKDTPKVKIAEYLEKPRGLLGLACSPFPSTLPPGQSCTEGMPVFGPPVLQYLWLSLRTRCGLRGEERIADVFLGGIFIFVAWVHNSASTRVTVVGSIAVEQAGHQENGPCISVILA